MSKYLALLVLLAASSAGAQPILDVKFADGNFAGYVERVGTGVALAASPDGKKCLGIDGSVRSLALKPVSLKPLTKYKLTIRAAVDSKDTAESNDRIPDFVVRTSRRNFSGYEVTFLGKDGKETGFRLRGTALVGNSGTIVSGNVQDVVHVFYSPSTVDKLRLTLMPNKTKLLIESIKLEIETEEGTVNCNPDFRYGELCLSGWDPDSEGRLYRRPDGKTVLNSGVGAVSPLFPVSEKSRYSFYCKATAREDRREWGSATVSFYDEKGSHLGTQHLFWAEVMKDGATKKGMQPLPGATYARVNVRRSIFEELRVTKDK